MTDNTELCGGEVDTADEAAAVQRVLGYCDGWADQWAAENNIADQISRMFGGAQPELSAHLLKWSKQCFGEGCYHGYREEQATAKTCIIEPLRATITSLSEENRRLREALGPFAKIRMSVGDSLLVDRGDMGVHHDGTNIRADDVVRAAAALSTRKDQHNG